MGKQMARRAHRGTTVAGVAAALAMALAACGQGMGDQSGGPVALPAGSATTDSGDSPTSPVSSGTSTRTVRPAATPTATPTSVPTRTSAPQSSEPTTPKPTPTKTTRPTPTEKPKQKPKPSETKPPKPARVDLRVGDHGPRVLELQQRLSELGYWLGEPDGDFGHLTQQAVWAFQKSAGLSRDGRVGPRTQRALDDGIRPSTRLNGNGIDINLSRQILMIVRDGRVKYILNTSTGGGYEYEQKDGDTVTARTPKGTYKVYYTVDGKDEGFLGDMWRPRYFHGGYAVHGSPSIPAYPASHGCARVSNSAMNMIWARDYMPKGSTVLVR